MILESLDLEDYMNEHLGSAGYLLRVMRYKAPKTDDPKLGLTTHKDKGYTTILCQHQVDGLEVETKDGQWIEVTYSTPNSLHSRAFYSCMDKWETSLSSPSGDDEGRQAKVFSWPIFYPGYMIKAPGKLIDEEHPVHYKPFDYTKFLAYVYSDEGLKEELPLTTYCGVGLIKIII